MERVDRDRVVGFTCSTWDLMHAGHAAFLRDCRERCDHLVVGLQTHITDRPEKNQPVQTVLERYLQLVNSRWVDEVVPYESEIDLMNLLHVLGDHTRFVGTDYAGKQVTGEHMYMKDGYELCYINRWHGWSTTSLRERIIRAEEAKGEGHDGSTVAEGSVQTRRD